DRAPLKVPGVASARLSAMVLDSALTMVSLNQPSWLIAIGRLLSQDDVDVLALAALGIGAFGHLVAELVGHGLEPLPRRVAALGHLVAGSPGPASRPDLDALRPHVLAESDPGFGVPRHDETASYQRERISGDAPWTASTALARSAAMTVRGWRGTRRCAASTRPRPGRRLGRTATADPSRSVRAFRCR